jgi:hypothetical protein
MSTIVTRAGKGSPLTHNEVDANFNNLNTDKYQSGDVVTFASAVVTGSATLNGTSIPSNKTLLVTTDIGSTVQGYDADTVKYDDANPSFTATSAIKIPAGTTGERPTGVAGKLRFNSTTNEFEGYNGTAWASVGGSAISNDTSTSTDVYPAFLNATTGTATAIYTSNAKLLYKPSTGELKASQLVATNGLVVNNMTVAASYTIPSGYSASSVGAVTVSSGVTVTVPSGSRWVVL